MFRFLFYCIYRGLQRIPTLHGSNMRMTHVDRSLYIMYILLSIVIIIFAKPIVVSLVIPDQSENIVIGLGIIFIITQGYFFLQKNDNWKKVLVLYDTKPRFYIAFRFILTLLLPYVVAYQYEKIWAITFYYSIAFAFLVLMWWFGRSIIAGNKGIIPFEMQAGYNLQKELEKIDEPEEKDM